MIRSCVWSCLLRKSQYSRGWSGKLEPSGAGEPKGPGQVSQATVLPYPG